MQKINNNFSNQLHIIIVHSVLLPVNMEIIFIQLRLIAGAPRTTPS